MEGSIKIKRGFLKEKKGGGEDSEIKNQRADPACCWDKINALMSSAGYRDIYIQSKQMGYYLKNSLEWRDVLWNSGHRGLLSQLSGEYLKRFMNEHLKEVDGVADENGIWLEVEVLLATATLNKISLPPAASSAKQ